MQEFSSVFFSITTTFRLCVLCHMQFTSCGKLPLLEVHVEVCTIFSAQTMLERVSTEYESDTKFSDLEGMDEAIREVQEIVLFLRHCEDSKWKSQISFTKQEDKLTEHGNDSFVFCQKDLDVNLMISIWRKPI